MGTELSFPVPEEALKEIMDKYRLSDQHMARLYRAFTKADLDRSGAVTIDEFYEMLDEKRTVFGNEIFELLDTDTSGGLDFTEFVNAVCVFGFFGKLQMYQFCFYIFDKDKNGFIAQDELKSLITLLYAKGVVSNLKAGLYNFDTDKDGVVNFKEFVQMAQQFPQMLHPAFQIQNKLQQRTLGVKYFSNLKEANAKRKAKEKAEQAKKAEREKRAADKAEAEREKERKAAELELKIARGEAQMACCGPCAYDLNDTAESIAAEQKRKAAENSKLHSDDSGPKTKLGGMQVQKKSSAKVAPNKLAWINDDPADKEPKAKPKGRGPMHIDKTVNDDLNEDELAALSSSDRRKYERTKGVVDLNARSEEDSMSRSELREQRRRQAAAEAALRKAENETKTVGSHARRKTSSATAAEPPKAKKKRSMLAAPKKKSNRF
eukprot:INCI13956.3.p1 GENE.INCI13956.3~~INCI13956.3.p1  ORF type:complete len:434 (+),score=111.99 INCI13956.3:291-1592(+)